MKLSIIIPVYNSSKILNALIKSIYKNLFKKCEFLEVILVNDFSKDNSWETIKELKKEYKFIKGINLKENYGQHSAIFCGLKHFKGENVVCMDDDLQHDPEHIVKMVDQLKKYDVCYVKYKKREHNIYKILVSKLNNIVSSFLMNKSTKIYTSSFKCFNKKIGKKIASSNDAFIFLDYWIFKYTKNITSIFVTHNKRFLGQTNYGFRQLITLWSKMVFVIETKQNTFRYYILFILKYLFKKYLYEYVSFKENNKIEVIEII